MLYCFEASPDRAGLPGKVISFYIVPLDPAYPATAGRGTFRSTLLEEFQKKCISASTSSLLLN